MHSRAASTSLWRARRTHRTRSPVRDHDRRCGALGGAGAGGGAEAGVTGAGEPLDETDQGGGCRGTGRFGQGARIAGGGQAVGRGRRLAGGAAGPYGWQGRRPACGGRCRGHAGGPWSHGRGRRLCGRRTLRRSCRRRRCCRCSCARSLCSSQVRCSPFRSSSAACSIRARDASGGSAAALSRSYALRYCLTRAGSSMVSPLYCASV